MLISAETLHENIEDKNCLIFDCRFDLPSPDFNPDAGRNKYNQGHIPKAQYIDLERDLSASRNESSGRHPLPDAEDFINLLQQKGISPEKHVIIYDDKGGLIAARFWWMLRYWVMHTNVSILNGGFNAWQNNGFPLFTEEYLPEIPSHRYSISNSYLVSQSDIRHVIKTHQKQLIDARAPTRFTGEEENIDPIAGHIPTAHNIFCMGNLTENGYFKTKEALQSRFESITAEAKGAENIIHNCGSGVTACHNLFAMELAGFNGSALYAGSWSEWIQDPDNPIAIGP